MVNTKLLEVPNTSSANLPDAPPKEDALDTDFDESAFNIKKGMIKDVDENYMDKAV